MIDNLAGHGTVRYEIYSLKSIALFTIRLIYRWSAAIYGTELGLWHVIILTVSY